MSIHISKFIDRVAALEARQVKDFTCPMADAKGLHRDITKLLLELDNIRSEINNGSEIITIELTGQQFDK